MKTQILAAACLSLFVLVACGDAAEEPEPDPDTREVELVEFEFEKADTRDDTIESNYYVTYQKDIGDEIDELSDEDIFSLTVEAPRVASSRGSGIREIYLLRSTQDVIVEKTRFDDVSTTRETVEIRGASGKSISTAAFIRFAIDRNRMDSGTPQPIRITANVLE